MSLKVDENVVCASNSFDPDETLRDTELLGVSSGPKLFAYGSSVNLGGLRVNAI